MSSQTGRSWGRRIAGGALLAAAAVAGAATLTSLPAAAAGESWVLPHATVDPADATTTETVVLSGGCFWGVQGVYQHVNGVLSAVSGYSGGAANTANYETVSTGTTGHAESVEVVYDPSIVSFGEILRIFFSVVQDPTELNYQGPDHGTQYRSEIWFTTPAQQQVATAYVAQLDAASIYPAAIVTRVDPLEAFYPAEGYHQDFLIHNPGSAYIAYNDIPKVENLQTLFPEYWRDPPITVADTRPDLI